MLCRPIARVAGAQALEGATIDNAKDPAAFRQDLMNIAMTTLSSKVLAQDKEHFSEMAVNAVLKLRGSTNLDQIQIIKRAGSTLRDSYLDPDGFLLDKKIGVGCPKRMTDCKVMVANTPMDTDKVKIYGSKVKVDSVAKVAEIEAAEKQKMCDKVDRIIAHGCNVFINRQLIYNLPEQRFADAGVMSIEHSDFDGTERLALVLDGDIVSTFDTPGKPKLGSCALIEEVMIGEDKLVRFSGCPNSQASSIVIRGANEHVLDEAQRSLHDALCVLSQTVKNTRVLPGGGAPEMLMACAVEEAAKSVESKHTLAMEAYARALRMMPMHIADNAGQPAPPPEPGRPPPSRAPLPRARPAVPRATHDACRLPVLAGTTRPSCAPACAPSTTAAPQRGASRWSAARSATCSSSA